MKNILPTALAGLVLLATPSARAWPYQDGDALLIFRESGFNDVEFDLGNVSQFLNKPNGYTAAVGSPLVSQEVRLASVRLVVAARMTLTPVRSDPNVPVTRLRSQPVTGVVKLLGLFRN